MLDSTDEQPQSTSSSIPMTRVLGRVGSLAGAGAGGDGVVTSFKDNGGHLLTHVQVVLVFWGTAWADTPPPTPSFNQVVAAIQGIPSGPYLAKLKQYRSIGKGSVVKIDSNTATNPQSQFTNDEVVQMVKGRITGRNVPAPNDNLLYCVILPQGFSSKDHPGDAGYHYTFDMNGTRGYIAWISNDGTLTSLNSIPKVFCHELAEACTDPDTDKGSGIIVNHDSEIGDVCNSTALIINGVAFQTYWSQEDKLCILPQSLRLFLKAKGVNHVRAVQPSGSISLKSLMGL